ncbi:hypothetical protein [Pseudobacteriovorax antillogorgiicola]|nr:hypothetical protein [Pseudobacteriovorax antillogorgiicola]
MSSLLNLRLFRIFGPKESVSKTSYIGILSVLSLTAFGSFLMGAGAAYEFLDRPKVRTKDYRPTTIVANPKAVSENVSQSTPQTGELAKEGMESLAHVMKIIPSSKIKLDLVSIKESQNGYVLLVDIQNKSRKAIEGNLVLRYRFQYRAQARVREIVLSDLPFSIKWRLRKRIAIRDRTHAARFLDATIEARVYDDGGNIALDHVDGVEI